MHIEKAKEEDAKWLNETILEEFPYTKFTPESITTKITDPRFAILLARQNNILTGFCEIEFFIEKNEARLNAIYVEEAWRDQGIAKMMIDEMINECKHKKIKRFFLLVKETNENAKALYKKTGFKFEGMHPKKIEDTKIEIWAQKV